MLSMSIRTALVIVAACVRIKYGFESNMVLMHSFILRIYLVHSLIVAADMNVLKIIAGTTIRDQWENNIQNGGIGVL